MSSTNLQVHRVRHETKRRQLTVLRVEPISPHMLRVVLGGEELRGFVSLGFDDHVKLFFSELSSENPPNSEPIMRDYTPHRYDETTNELEIHFALHDDGPATAWAKQARPGQSLTIGGPRGSFIIPTGFDWHLLIGDDSALPAIGRRLAELPADARALVVAEIESPEDEQNLVSAADCEIIWVHRMGRPTGAPILDTLRSLTFPDGQYYAWVACESAAAKAIRRYLADERGTEKHRIRAAGYWKHGAAAVHETHED